MSRPSHAPPEHPMQPPGDAPRASLLRAMGANAFLLSVLYLGAGLLLELAFRLRPSAGLRRASASLESLPAQALQLLGLLEPLRQAHFEERISTLGVRLVFGAVAVGVICLLAVVVGSATGLLRLLAVQLRARRQRPGSPPHP